MTNETNPFFKEKRVCFIFTESAKNIVVRKFPAFSIVYLRILQFISN